MRLMFCCLSLLAVSVFGKPLQLSINGRNAILINADTGIVLYEKHAHVPTYPASTTKIATALYVLEEKKVDLTQLVTVSAEAMRMKTGKNRSEAPPHWLESDGTMMGIVKGEVLTVDALLHGMMLISGNDAANTIAEHVSGSVPAFMEELNSYLKKIGCSQTTYYTPHGYHYEHHKTTAADLALITQKALQNPTFREIVVKASYMRPKTNKRASGEIRQFNKLMDKENKHYYPKAIGVKTGYTDLARNCLVAAATDNGRTLIAVVLGAEKRALGFADARNLFEAAFAEKPQTRLLVPAMQTYQKTFEGAKKPLTAILVEDFTYSYYPAEDVEVKAFVHWDELQLPIRKGQKVGQIRAFAPNKTLLASADLYAREEVEENFFFVLKDKLIRLLR